MTDEFDDEEYRGPATLRFGDAELAVTIRLSAHFEPVEGRFRWAGRTTAHDALRERVSGGLKEAVVILPGGRETRARLSEPDPWGGVRLSGTGPPPWFRDQAPPSRKDS
ncbi:DUF4873 domain-containing protein [Micromonosporaceae bacterium Da 78-11]